MHLSTSFLSQNNFNAMMMPSVQVPNQQQCSFGVQFPNNHMFSSSYPLKDFYRQQQPAVNSTFTYENDPRFSYEPTKRVKINNESERIIQNNIHAQLSPQTIQSTPIKHNYNYRAPNVSSRLPLMKGQHNMELLRQNVEVNHRDNQEPLMIPELTTEAFNDLYNKKIESIQEELEIQKKLYLHHVIKAKIKESAKWLRSVKENSKKDQGTKSAEDALKEEYITRQIKQNILPLLKLCKKNQEDLAQYLKTPIPELKNQNYLNKTFEKLEADTITFDINIKQESPY